MWILAILIRITLISCLVLDRYSSCETDDDCSLAGSCVPSTGTCICDPGWRGTTCGQINAGSAPVDAPVHRNGSWTWGGSPIQNLDDKRWHLFFSFITNRCGLLHYQTNSIVRHAVAETPLGPWHMDSKITLAPRKDYWDSGAIHGPTVHYDSSTNHYLLFYMGTNYRKPALDCSSNSSIPSIYISNTRRIGVAFSLSLDGPWQRLDQPILSPRSGSQYWDNSDVSNAAPYVFPNGTILLGYRAGGDGVALGGGIGVAVADHWRGPYLRKTGHDEMLFAAEDAFLWRDHRGRFHILVHRFANNASTQGTAVGGHAWSKDGWTWTYEDNPNNVAYTTKVIWNNGSKTVLYRRERPQPIINGSGFMSHLFTGAWPCHFGSENNDGQDIARGCQSFTMVVPVGD